MTRFLLSATTALTLTASAALAATDVKEIDVDVDLAAVENIEAAQVWTQVAPDLETAIAERLVDQLDDRGARVLIEIDEVELANSFQQATDTGDARLSGEVNIRVPGIANNEKYNLTVSAEQASAYFPSGIVIADLTTGSEVYYQAMINAFADNVADKLQ